MEIKNRPVSLPVAEMLKKHGFEDETFSAWVDYSTQSHPVEPELTKYSNKQNHNKRNHKISAPSVLDASLFVYRKYKVWISVNVDIGYDGDIFSWSAIGQDFGNQHNSGYTDPIFAHEDAIKYVLERVGNGK